MTGRIAPVRVLVAGLAGALAMMPVGFLAERLGHQVNRYGELLAEHLLGTSVRPVLLAEHLAIGVLSAVPPALLCMWRPLARGRAAVAGLAYGGGYWLAVNSLALPLVFAQPLPWKAGPPALLPSLAVHLVHGLVTALVLAGAGPSRTPTAARSRARREASSP